jgi:hypothetical protein
MRDGDEECGRAGTVYWCESEQWRAAHGSYTGPDLRAACAAAREAYEAAGGKVAVPGGERWEAEPAAREPLDTIAELLTCASSWNSEARLVGNVRAADMWRALYLARNALEEHDGVEAEVERLRGEVAQWRHDHATLVAARNVLSAEVRGQAAELERVRGELLKAQQLHTLNMQAIEWAKGAKEENDRLLARVAELEADLATERAVSESAERDNDKLEAERDAALAAQREAERERDEWRDVYRSVSHDAIERAHQLMALRPELQRARDAAELARLERDEARDERDATLLAVHVRADRDAAQPAPPGDAPADAVRELPTTWRRSAKALLGEVARGVAIRQSAESKESRAQVLQSCADQLERVLGDAPAQKFEPAQVAAGEPLDSDELAVFAKVVKSAVAMTQYPDALELFVQLGICRKLGEARAKAILAKLGLGEPASGGESR